MEIKYNLPKLTWPLAVVILFTLACITYYLTHEHINSFSFNKDGFKAETKGNADNIKKNLETAKTDIFGKIGNLNTEINNEQNEEKKEKLENIKNDYIKLYNQCDSMLSEYIRISFISNTDEKTKLFQAWINKSTVLFAKYSNKSVNANDIFSDIVGNIRKSIHSLDSIVATLKRANTDLIKNNTQLKNDSIELHKKNGVLTDEKKAEVKKNEILSLEKDAIRIEKDKIEAAKKISDAILEKKGIVVNMSFTPIGEERLKNDILYLPNNKSPMAIQITVEVEFINPNVNDVTIYAEIDKTYNLIDALSPEEVCGKKFNYAQKVKFTKGGGKNKILTFSYGKKFLFVPYTITLHSSECNVTLPLPMVIELKKEPFKLF